MENMGISRIPEGHIGSVEQAVACRQHKLQNSTTQYIGQEAFLMLPHPIIQIQQRKGSRHGNCPPSAVPENNDQGKENKKQGTVPYIWLCQLLLAECDHRPDHDKAKQNGDPYRIFQYLSVQVIHILCQMCLIVGTTCNPCCHQINQVIYPENILQSEHGDHRKSKPDHFLPLCHSMVDIIKTAHIFTAGCQCPCNTDGLEQISCMTLQIICRDHRILSFSAVVDPIEQDH